MNSKYPTRQCDTCFDGRMARMVLLVMCCLAGIAGADTVKLRRSVVVPADSTELTLRMVAELTGPAATAAGDAVIRSAADWQAEGGSVVTLKDVRAALTANGTSLGRLAFSGGRCQVHIGSKVTAEEAADRAAELAVVESARKPVDTRPGVWASDLVNEGTLRGQMARLIANDVQKRAAKKIRLEFADRDRAELQLSTAAHDFEIIPQATASSAVLPLQIKVFQGDRFIRSFRLVVKLWLEEDVFVAQRYLSRGETIRPGDFLVETQLLEPDSVAVLPTSESLIGKETRGRIVKGEVLRVGDALAPVSVKRNAEIKLIIKRGDFTISMLGRALESGRTGEIIRVRSLKNKTEMRALVDDSGILTVVSD